MPRIKSERKAARRAQIIAAARACFARTGFDKTTLQDVFAQAGLSAGCIYNYFNSKDQLMLAVAQERHEDELRMIGEGLETKDPINDLRQLAKKFTDEYLTPESADKRRIALQTWSEALVNPSILASVQEGLEQPRAHLAHLIRRAQAAKRITSKLDADAIALTLIAMLHGSMLQRLWKPGTDSGAQFAVLEHFLQTLESKRVEPRRSASSRQG
jgi:AcrR family transcriptional regulator